MNGTLSKGQPDRFDMAVNKCRQKHSLYRRFAKRTHAALYESLAEGYQLFDDVHTDAVMGARFRNMLADMTKRQRKNPALALILFLYFPHLLEYGKGNKNETDLASRYAALYNKARERGIAPPRFQSEAPKIGVQGAATKGKQKKPRAPGKRTGAVGAGIASDVDTNMNPEPFYPKNRELGKKLSDLVLDSYWEPKRLSVEVLIDAGRCEFIGLMPFNHAASDEFTTETTGNTDASRQPLAANTLSRGPAFRAKSPPKADLSSVSFAKSPAGMAIGRNRFTLAPRRIQPSPTAKKMRTAKSPPFSKPEPR